MTRSAWLVLSGSGMRLYAFLGAILALAEEGIVFSGVTGTSGGAVIALLLGKHWDPKDPVGSVERAIKEALSIDVGRELKKSFRLRIWEWTLTSVFRRGPKGMFNSKRLLETFRAHMPETLADCRLPVHITSYQVNLKAPRAVLFKDLLTDAPLAALGSMSLPPPLFDPTMYGKAMLQDGGWTKNFPIPDNQPRVIGLYFDDVRDGEPSNNPIEDDSDLIEIKDNIALWKKIVFGVIDTNMRESIEEAKEEGVDLIKIRLSTTISGFDFFADADKRRKAIDEGYSSVKRQLYLLK